MASVVVIARSKATHLCGAFSLERSVITAAGVVSEPVPTVVFMAMCGGFSSFSEALTPWNSLMFLPSWAATTLAPLVVSCGLPPPMETNPSHSASLNAL